MSVINISVDSKLSRSARARQLEAIFDVPPSESAHLEWKGELPIDDREWNIGLIVGPSGCGKSTILRDQFREPRKYKWTGASVLDDFDAELSVQSIGAVCQAVGFNTIPAWLRPFKVLSNGEQFRVDLARRLAGTDKQIVVDEFTSVVDRQVAKIGAHAVQKYVRKSARKFVAASCHYDIIDWLQPDWILEPATMAFSWRSLQRRPPIHAQIARVPYEVWREFAPFHYLTASLARSARCFALIIDGRAAAFAGMMYRPHPRVRDIYGCSRLVTLPDFQGLGLAFVLIDRIAAVYRSGGFRTHTYPAHPALIRGFDRSKMWRLVKKPGAYSPVKGASGTVEGFGGRPCAVFEYVGTPHPDKDEARRLLQ